MLRFASCRWIIDESGEPWTTAAGKSGLIGQVRLPRKQSKLFKDFDQHEWQRRPCHEKKKTLLSGKKICPRWSTNNISSSVLEQRAKEGGRGAIVLLTKLSWVRISVRLVHQHRKTLLNRTTKQKQRTRSTNNISSTECLVLCKERGHYTKISFCASHWPALSSNLCGFA